MSNVDTVLTQHMNRVTDPQPTVIATDNTGVTFGIGYPGYLGSNMSDVAVDGPAGNSPTRPSAGYPGQYDGYAGVAPMAMLRSNSAGYIPNPEYGGAPGRTDRLAYDVKGPATSTSVESFKMSGSRIRPGRADIAKGGPVGTGGDLGQYLAVAMAQSTYDFPAQDLSQLYVALGL